MIRTVLHTYLADSKGKVRETIYGRYDPVTLQKECDRKGLHIKSTEVKKYSMTDADFVKYGKELK